RAARSFRRSCTTCHGQGDYSRCCDLGMAEMVDKTPEPGSDEAIRAYKTILSQVIDQRPSGMRQRLADALGKHRSFVTQISSPAYSIPIPSKHLPSIFTVCHFSQVERDQFMAAYHQAHPGKVPVASGPRRTRHVSLIVPD